MKVVVHYAKVIEGMDLVQSAQQVFTKDFNSLDEAREWLTNPDEPVIGYNVDIYEEAKDDKGQIQATVREV